MPFVDNFVNKSWKVLRLESLHGPRELTLAVNNQYVAIVYHLYEISVKIASCPTLFFINKLHLSHDFSYLPRTQWIFKRCSTSKGNDKKINGHLVVPTYVTALFSKNWTAAAEISRHKAVVVLAPGLATGCVHSNVIKQQQQRQRQRQRTVSCMTEKVLEIRFRLRQ